MRAKNADWAIDVADNGRAEASAAATRNGMPAVATMTLVTSSVRRRVAGRIGEQPRNLAAGKGFQHDAGPFPFDRGHQGAKVLVVVAGLRGDDHRRGRVIGQLGETAEFLGAQQVSVVDHHSRAASAGAVAGLHRHTGVAQRVANCLQSSASFRSRRRR